MARRCDITGKRVITGNKVSKANNKTKRTFCPNLQKKKIFFKELGIWLIMKISTKAMRTINKHGLYHTMKKAAKKETLSPKFTALINQL